MTANSWNCLIAWLTTLAFAIAAGLTLHPVAVLGVALAFLWAWKASDY